MTDNYRIKRGILFVISAPSGAGKTTLCRNVLENMPDIKFSVSYTTRSPRQGEVDGVHYNFIDAEEFRGMIAGSEFIEWAEVHGNFYGTSRKKIAEMTLAGIDVLLDIDVQGARQVKESLPDSVLIFILPPSFEVLKERLTGRMTDTDEVIEKRLKKAADEIREYKNYDYVIVNNVIENALTELKSIIIAERVRAYRLDNKLIERQYDRATAFKKKFIP
jgi:guanylate kinase